MLTLVLGGAASGKSAYAESLVLKTGLPRYYLATMQVWDAECAARVEKHRKMRAQKQFETLECPLHLDRLALPGRGTVLLEDLGNLVANELYSPGGAGKHTAEAVLAGLERLAAGCDNLIVVSNEVFSGGADYAGDTDQYLLELPVVFAKKKKPSTMENMLVTSVYSFTKQRSYDVCVSKDFLAPGDQVLFIDDFLANGNAAKGIMDLVKQAGAELVGMGFIIEKAFQHGGDELRSQGIHVESLAIIESLDNCEIKIR